jgi:hypothetical protein
MSSSARTLPDIDFATFILSLGSSALMHLGIHESEDQPLEVEPDLSLAKQTIDILAMLEVKTRGNRDEAEDRLLSSLLYDLRIKYVDALRKQPATTG